MGSPIAFIADPGLLQRVLRCVNRPGDGDAQTLPTPPKQNPGIFSPEIRHNLYNTFNLFMLPFDFWQ